MRIQKKRRMVILLAECYAAQRSKSTLRNKMAGWREEQPQPGVVRGWMVRKVNSEQKKRASQKNKFRLGNAICFSLVH